MRCLREKEENTVHYFALIPEMVFPSLLGVATPTEIALLKYLIEDKPQMCLGQKCFVFSAFSGQRSFLDWISPAYIEKTAKSIAKSRKQKYKQQNYYDAFKTIINRLSGMEQVFVRTMELMEQ